MSPSHEDVTLSLHDCIKHIKNIPVSSGEGGREGGRGREGEGGRVGEGEGEGEGGRVCVCVSVFFSLIRGFSRR